MVDWNSPAQIASDGARFSSLMHIMFGIYLWEVVISMPFDAMYIFGKKRWKWPLMFYFANRYSLLVAMVGISVALNIKEEVNCQALYTFNQVFGNAAIGLASINLSLRTMAVWGQNRWIVGVLCLMIILHWVLLLHGLLIKADWVPGVGCVITGTNHKLLAATFCYTMSFDFAVLVLTGWKLLATVTIAGATSPLKALLTGNSLALIIFKDGLIFFVIAILANLVATVFLFMGLNPVMSIIANVPAAIASSVVACRVVRRLSTLPIDADDMPGVPISGGQPSTLAFRSNQHRTELTTMADSRYKSNPGGVHVQMDTFPSERSFVDFEHDHKSPPTPKEHFDVDGRPSTNYDPEAQISNEFKRPPY